MKQSREIYWTKMILKRKEELKTLIDAQKKTFLLEKIAKKLIELIKNSLI